MADVSGIAQKTAFAQLDTAPEAPGKSAEGFNAALALSGSGDLMAVRRPSSIVTPESIAAGLTKTFGDGTFENDLRTIANSPAVASLPAATRKIVMDEAANILGTVQGALQSSGLFGADILADRKITTRELPLLIDLLASPVSQTQTYADVVNTSYNKIRNILGDTKMPQSLKDIANLLNPRL